MKLTFKIISLILVALLTVLVIFSYFFIKEGRDTYSYLLNERGKSLTSVIASASLEMLLIEDYPVLETYVQNIQNEYEEVISIQILKDDKVVVRIKKQQDDFQDIYYFKSLIKIDGDIIGEVKLNLSSIKGDKKIEDRIKQLIFLIIITFVLLFLFLIFIVDNFLLSQIRLFIAHTKRIGTGNYDEKIIINTQDEFGKLASSINDMTNNINKTHKDLEESNQDLTIKTKELIKSNHYKNVFLANMSHELKTPLNSINTISDIMAKNTKNDLTQEQSKNLTIINNCGKDLLYLINDILDISKLEEGEMALRLEPVDILDVLKNLRDMFIHQTNTQNVEFIYKFDSKLKMIYSDKERIKQIVKNLLSNAIKFTQNGKVRLHLEDDGDNIVITVKDDGIGIPKDKLSYIFDRFKQVDDSTTRKYQGTGLGLAISKELVNLLGGYITVHSKLGFGSTFIVNIPKETKKEHINFKKVNIIYDDNLQLEEPKEEITSIKKIENKIKNVLFFNSDPVSLFNIAIALKKSKKDIVSVNELSDIFKAIEKDNFDILIVDTDNEQIDIKVLYKKSNEKNIQLIGIGNTDTNNNLDFFINKSSSINNMIDNLNTL